MAEINTPIDNNEEFDKFEMLRARFQEWLAYGESALEQEIEPVSGLVCRHNNAPRRSYFRHSTRN